MTLSAGAVARQLGISPATLRTWAHRYGIEPSERSEGAHRRYTPEDIDRLMAMQRLVRSGVPVADAAARVREGTADLAAPVPELYEQEREPARGAVRTLWEAAVALDGYRCSTLIATMVREVGVLQTWENVIAPVLLRAGELWERDSSGIDIEHVLSEAVTAGLAVNHPVKREGVLLAAADGEDHVLPLYALRAALAEQGIGCELLAARTPASALGQAAKRLHPAVVILWSRLPETANPDSFDCLPGLRPRPALAVAGPGWSDCPARLNVPHLGDLREAVNFVRSHV